MEQLAMDFGEEAIKKLRWSHSYQMASQFGQDQPQEAEAMRGPGMHMPENMHLCTPPADGAKEGKEK